MHKPPVPVHTAYRAPRSLPLWGGSVPSLRLRRPGPAEGRTRDDLTRLLGPAELRLAAWPWGRRAAPGSGPASYQGSGPSGPPPPPRSQGNPGPMRGLGLGVGRGRAWCPPLRPPKGRPRLAFSTRGLSRVFFDGCGRSLRPKAADIRAGLAAEHRTREFRAPSRGGERRRPGTGGSSGCALRRGLCSAAGRGGDIGAHTEKQRQ